MLTTLRAGSDKARCYNDWVLLFRLLISIPGSCMEEGGAHAVIEYGQSETRLGLGRKTKRDGRQSGGFVRPQAGNFEFPAMFQKGISGRM